MPRHARPSMTVILASSVERGEALRTDYGTRRTRVYSSATARTALHGWDMSRARVVLDSPLWHEPGMPQILRDFGVKEVLVVL